MPLSVCCRLTTRMPSDGRGHRGVGLELGRLLGAESDRLGDGRTYALALADVARARWAGPGLRTRGAPSARSSLRCPVKRFTLPRSAMGSSPSSTHRPAWARPCRRLPARGCRPVRLGHTVEVQVAVIDDLGHDRGPFQVVQRPASVSAADGDRPGDRRGVIRVIVVVVEGVARHVVLPGAGRGCRCRRRSSRRRRPPPTRAHGSSRGRSARRPGRRCR